MCVSALGVAPVPSPRAGVLPAAPSPPPFVSPKNPPHTRRFPNPSRAAPTPPTCARDSLSPVLLISTEPVWGSASLTLHSSREHLCSVCSDSAPPGPHGGTPDRPPPRLPRPPASRLLSKRPAISKHSLLCPHCRSHQGHAGMLLSSPCALSFPFTPLCCLRLPACPSGQRDAPIYTRHTQELLLAQQKAQDWADVA